MTTIATSTDVVADRDTRIPFGRLVRAERRKLTDTRASRWLLAAILAITPIVVVGTLLVAPTKDLTYNKLVDFSLQPQRILLPVLGIMAMTSEWSQRTGLLTFTLEPRRHRVILAKVVGTLGLGIPVVATTFVAAAIGNLLGIALRHGDGSWAFGVAGFAEVTLVQLIGLMQGMAFGMALLATAAAIVVFYVVPNLFSVAINSLSSRGTAAHWLDLNQAGGNLYNQQITATGWLQLLVAATLWVLVPLGIGIWRVTRTEVRTT